MKESKGRNGGTLRSMEKGDTPPPGAGRPKGSPNLSTKFKKFLNGETEYIVGGEVVKMTRDEVLMFRLFQIAQEGDETKFGESKGVSVAAIREIYDRAFGKSTQPLEHSGPDGGPIEVETPVWVIRKAAIETDGGTEEEKAE